MLLKSLKVKDFRQFIGEQQVQFATDSSKNVTIIMGENGSGKTSLAQVFTWCLYGTTDFDDNVLLCRATAKKMLPDTEETVRAELFLVHNDIEYEVIREQRYQTDGVGNLKRPSQTVFKIAYKKTDGQREFVKDIETEIRMKEILPKELSKYFLFDGERIGNMSKEIRKGKSREFAEAVRNLLGLSAFSSALGHLKEKGKNSVIRSYDESFDDKSDSKIAQYTQRIETYNEEIDKIEKRQTEIEGHLQQAKDFCDDLNERIRKNADSGKLALEKDRLVKKKEGLVDMKAMQTSSLLKSFNNIGPAYFSKKLIKDALQGLSDADKIDKGIPDIHARTIEYLIERKNCICGTPITVGSKELDELLNVLKFIPPQSIGNLIGQFVQECEMRSKTFDTFFEEFTDKFAFIRTFEVDYAEMEHDVKSIEQKLIGMEKIGELQANLSRFENEARKLQSEFDNLNFKKGSVSTSRDRCETERGELTLKDENNRRIETYKAYAQYMYDVLLKQYRSQETETREKLQETVNEIFTSIYNGGFSLAIDEKYNIQILVNDDDGYIEDVETSTAQSISVIFAFIAGVIKMARESQNPENELLVSEPYPLVMDAPLSSFDKTRIKTVCEVLPKVAEQVIIFIKDTDGELAETYMSDKVGKRYTFDKRTEFETYLIEGE